MNPRRQPKSRSPKSRARRTPPRRTADPSPQQIMETWRAEHEESERTICTLNLFWVACPQGACRRVRRCAGDPFECFERRWDVLPPEEQQYRRDFLEAAVRTKSFEQAMAFANARVAERRRREEEYFARTGARA